MEGAGETHRIHSEDPAIFRFALSPAVPAGRVPPDGAESASPPVARLLDEATGRELDAAPLVDDPGIYPEGIALFGIAYNGERFVRLVVEGPGANAWRSAGPPVLHQTLGDSLSGFEEWYTGRDAFYGEGYFAGTDRAGKAALALKLRAAGSAQARFADALLAEISFRSSLEFGCASGAMVHALRARGVDARGADLSPFILSRAAADVRDYLVAGDFSLLDRLEERVDAIIGQEVFEHLPPPEVDGVFRRIRRAASDRLVFTVPCTPRNGWHHIDRFEDLPKDGEGNPVEGHLVQATRWWWIARAILAGFAFEERESLRVRRRFLEAGRRWNLFVFRPVREDGKAEILARLDGALRPSFEGIRQLAADRFLETGRLARAGGEIVVAAGPDDPGGHIYYGPYLASGRGRVRWGVRVRAGEGRRSLAPRPEDPALWIEITSGTGTLHETGIPAGRLASRTRRWIEQGGEAAVDGDRDVQVKVYHTGISDLELVWPPACEFIAGRGPGMFDRVRRWNRKIRRRMRGR